MSYLDHALDRILEDSSTQLRRHLRGECSKHEQGEFDEHPHCMQCGAKNPDPSLVSDDPEDCAAGHPALKQSSLEDPEAYAQYPYCRNCGDKVF